MAILWLSVQFVDREVKGRSVAERASNVLEAVRKVALGYNYTSFSDSETPHFYLIKTNSAIALVKAVHDALGEGDVALHRSLNINEAGLIRGGNPLANPAPFNREASFDRFWRK